MKEANEEKITGLPENAYRELNEGEEYQPILSPDKKYPEASAWSITWGLLMAILFSAAAAYLGLKVGQVFEAAIPIAIIAIGVSGAAKRKNALGENVIIQSIGASSGVIVAGAIFTLPALYILDLDAAFYQIFLSSLLGGFLGILFLIPFRKYFVKTMHGKYPFPEATATTEVLVSGAKGGNQAKLLIVSGLIGGLYDFIAGTLGWWKELISTTMIPLGETIAEKTKMVFKVNTGAAVLGLGYIIGLKYAAIICAGSFVGWYVIIPLLSQFADVNVMDGVTTVNNVFASMSPDSIFSSYVKPIGIGGIAMSGIVGIIRSSGIIKSAFGLAVKELGGKSKLDAETKRTQRDLPMKIIAIGIIVTLILIFLFFYLGVINNLGIALIALGIVTVIAFLFTTVAANAIAIVGTNPVSGMTLMTLIITSIVLVSVGLSGTSGMVAALLIGGVICTALSMAGGFITDLKIGYWIGTSPIKQQTWKFLGTFVSAATVGGIIMLLNDAYGFGAASKLQAPQANAMAAVIEPMMSGQGAPWMLYGVGAALALILTMIGVPALAFALGMFIPLELNTPLLIGGIISWFVAARGKDTGVNKARKERGTLIASGFIAGGALMGVVSALLKFANLDLEATSWLKTTGADILTLLAYVLIIGYFVWDSKRAKPQEE
ncbi:MAG: oligopeptide transporter, OPT family [Prevotellaceae bacterium]|jgi:putative OPT family oligopeptide transporter|nr:oligopeptide transporter, OPT family [Prevotellaceae bacterium]